MKSRSAIGFVCVALLTLGISQQSANAQPVLTLEGSCPGTMRAEVTGGVEGIGFWLLFSPRQGSFRLRPPHACQGVRLGLAWRGIRYTESAVYDEFGFAQIEGNVGPGACGGFLQVLNGPRGNCEISNVVQIN